MINLKQRIESLSTLDELHDLINAALSADVIVVDLQNDKKLAGLIESVTLAFREMELDLTMVIKHIAKMVRIHEHELSYLISYAD